MKYKLLGFVMIAIILMASVMAYPAEIEEKKGRVHQHLTSRWEHGCDCDGSQLCTHLPLVMMDTYGQEIPGLPTGQTDILGHGIYSTTEDGSATITMGVSVIDNQETNNHPDDTPAFSTPCQVHIRGNSSRRFPKSSYSLVFVDNLGNSADYEVMGMKAHHEWVLNGPILDKTLVRNYMWYNISGELMNYAPNARFCELILNGEYRGVYLMVEGLTDDPGGRLNLSLRAKNKRGTGYLLRMDRPTEEDLETTRDIYSYNERMSNFGTDIAIRYPGKKTLTPELAKDIELDYSAFERALFSYDYDTEAYGYWNWIDVNNFVDYYLINEFTHNADAGKYSTYIYKEVGQKYRLCVWDFNNCCDNYQERESDIAGFGTVEQAWFFMLFKDEAFVEKVIDRYRELRESYLSDEYLMDYIDETLAYLGPALERNNERWADEIAGWDALVPAERNVHSHEEAVDQLKNWILARGAWLDEHIDALKFYGHPSKNKVYNH